jgi:hypothetical protein
MQRAFRIFCFVGAAALASVSAQAACGGGGYKPALAAAKAQEASATKSQEVSYTKSDEKTSKLDGVQRDVDKAQLKLDNCQGDCDKERRKLAEAKAKYDKKAGEVK